MKIKSLTVGIIFLFVTIAISPSICAFNDSFILKVVSILQNEDAVSISVLEYKADLTVKSSMVKMSREQMEKFNAELNETNNDTTLHLSIYKKYGLMPAEVTWKSLKERAKENAQRLGLTQQKLEQIASKDMCIFLKQENQKNQGSKIYINMFCEFSCRFGSQSIILPIKLTTFMVLFHKIGYKIKTFNLRDRIISYGGALISVGNGLLPDFRVWFPNLSYTKIIGFVGYIFISNSFWYCTGFAVYLRTFGIEYEKLNT